MTQEIGVRCAESGLRGTELETVFAWSLEESTNGLDGGRRV